MPCKRVQLHPPIATGPGNRVWSSRRGECCRATAEEPLIGSAQWFNVVGNVLAPLASPASWRKMWTRAMHGEFELDAVPVGSCIFWSSPKELLQTGQTWKLMRWWLLFSCVLKSLCFTIILTRVVGSKALQEQGRGVLLTLLVCVFLLGFGPDFLHYVTPACSKQPPFVWGK